MNVPSNEPHNPDDRLPQYVVTLVHGTFARDAEWTRPGSIFCETLERHLSPQHVLFTRFLWSGWNSPWSRNKARRRLSESLSEQLNRYPYARHYVVGHSHGGNIAVQSVFSDKDLQKKVAGVATLATPFIHARPRSNNNISDPELLTWLIFFPLAVFLGWEIYWMFSSFGEDVISGVLLGGVAAASAALPAVYIAARLANLIARVAKNTSDSLQSYVPSDANLMIIRMIGDEASALLATSQLFSWAISRVWNFLGRICWPLFWIVRHLARFGQLLQAVLITLAIYFCGLIVEAFIWDSVVGAIIAGTLAGGSTESVSDLPYFFRFFRDLFELFLPNETHGPSIWVERATAILLLVSVVVGSVYAFLSLIIMPAVILLSLVLVPFGLASAFAGLYSDISVEIVPTGIWSVYQFGPPENQNEDGGLMHSAAYSDPRAIRELARWISEETV